MKFVRGGGVLCSVSTGVFCMWVNAAQVKKRGTACVCVVWFGVSLSRGTVLLLLHDRFVSLISIGAVVRGRV